MRVSITFGLTALLFLTADFSYAGQRFNAQTGRPDFCVTVEEEDGSPSMVACQRLEVSNGSLADDGDGAFSLTTGGGTVNSFETLSVPAGTNPVADSSTDTLTITETSFLTITGTAGTDTIDITQVTTDLGTDGLIAANAVALTTDTTGNYAAGDAEAGAALTGDSATSFFSTGTLEVGIGGSGAGTFTDGGILLGSGTAAFTALGVATNGQIPIGDGTTDPVLATITGGRSLLTTNGAGTITLDADAETYTDSKCILIETPADADDLLWFRTDQALTVTGLDCIVENATSAVAQVVECDADGNLCGSANTRLDESMTCAVTNTADDATIGNAGVVAGAWLRLQVGAVTGTPGHQTTCVTYTLDD